MSYLKVFLLCAYIYCGGLVLYLVRRVSPYRGQQGPVSDVRGERNSVDTYRTGEYGVYPK